MTRISKRTRRARLLLAVVAAAGLAGCASEGPAAPTPDVAPPPVPQPLSPTTGTLFTHFPRNTTLVWSAVTDPSAPVTYRVHAQFCQGSANNPTSCSDRPSYCPGVLTSTTCNFNFVGGQPGRWRVRAVDALGNESAFSDWSTFEFDS
jgi:eukaryotic-like serine/threonine-protein kinase